MVFNKIKNAVNMPLTNALRWGVRIATVYLIMWWECAYIWFFPSNTICHLSLRVLILSTLLFVSIHTCTFITTCRIGFRLRGVIMWPVLGMLFFYLLLLLSKFTWVFWLGVLTHCLGFWVLFKDSEEVARQ
jgi:hypothetical protein